MKTFYTERDIEVMHGQGVTEVGVDDDVVLTDLARERAAALGVSLVPKQAEPLVTPTTPPQRVESHALAAQVKARVVARLGTDEFNDLLDAIIPRVLARVLSSKARSGEPPSVAKDEY